MKVIYKISNPSNQVYIGQTKNVNSRWRKYRSSVKINQRKLYDSLRIYGHASHYFEIIHELPEDVDQNTLDQYEQLYMDLYRNCGFELLNIREGGLYAKCAEETKQIFSAQRKGRVLTEEWRRRLSQSRTGKPNVNKGKKFPHQKSNRRKGMSIGIYNVYRNGILIGSYLSPYECNEKTGLSSRTIFRLSQTKKEGSKGKNKGITVEFINK